MSEENPENHQDHNENGGLEDENLDSELDNSHTIRSGGANDLDEIDSLNDTDLPEDEEIDNPIEEIKDDNYSQNSSNTSELSTTDHLSTDPNDGHFELNSTNNNSDESSYLVTNDQSVNEIVKKEDEIRKQLELPENKPLLDEFFSHDEIPTTMNKNSETLTNDTSASTKKNNQDPRFDQEGYLFEQKDVSWYGNVIKGGGRGHGFATLPKDLLEDSGFNPGDRIILNISTGIDDEKLTVDTFYRANSRSRGFYIPKEITQNNDLLGNQFHFSAHKEEGFKTSVSQYKQVIIPYKKLDEYQIADRDIIKLRVETHEGKIIEEPVIVKQLSRNNRQNEFIAIFRNNDVEAGPANAKIQSKLETLEQDLLRSSENMIYTPNLIPHGHFGKIDDKTVILFKGGHSPIEIPLKIDVGENAHYMGCYFADGTKKGHAWKMSASTPEQAMYYNKIYDKLLPSEDFKFKVTYSKTPSDVRTADEISRDIKKYWEEKTDNSFSIDKVYIVDARVESALNRNKYGSLEIRNDKGLVMQFHQKMLDQTMEIISNSNDRKLLWNFVHGVFEGDGYVAGGTNRFGLGIACNLENYKFIQNIFDKLEIKYSTDMYRVNSGDSNAVGINFYKQEVLRHFAEIEPNIFKYYPKRADRFFMRLDGFDQPPRRQRR